MKDVLTISVCIATHERPQLLQGALSSIAEQLKRPDEIVISDSSLTKETGAVVEAFKLANPDLTIKYVQSERPALPWQRWWAFRNSCADVVLFLDDDVRLNRLALGSLQKAYVTLSPDANQGPAGIGFMMTWSDGERPSRNPNSLKERWLGTRRFQSGSTTPGGLGVSPDGVQSDRPVQVDLLWGGAMSFRHEVLEKIGLLDRLVTLYEEGVGRAEDAVLSACARQYGKLYLITGPMALHPRDSERATVPLPYAVDGWRIGLMGTWGRAHTMRWLASSRAAYARDWARYVILECSRCLLSIGRQPLRRANWERIGGACFGIVRSLIHWRHIAAQPRSAVSQTGADRNSLVSPPMTAATKPSKAE